MIDIEGQVDRFYKKLQARQEYVEEKIARETSKVSPERSVKEIGLPARATEALEKAGLDNVGKLLAKMAEGEAGMLAIDGFGRKSLIDMKKSLRQMGYELPSAADDNRGLDLFCRPTPPDFLPGGVFYPGIIIPSCHRIKVEWC